MKALIILAHGSRRAESNQEVSQLTDKVRQLAGKDYQLIKHAFLELAEPDLGSVFDELVQQGITEMTTLPYFLNSGNHVKQDIPELLANARAKHPACEFKLARPIGMYEGMPELILSNALNV